MGPSGVSRKRQVINTVAVVAVIAMIVIATVVANNKKSNSTDKVADTSSTTSTDTSNTAATDSTAAASTPSTSSSSTSGYKDGTYTAQSDYQAPGGEESITVKVTLVDGKVTDSTVTADTNDRESREYQDKFISGYKSLVIGKAIDTIRLSRVSGSSLTSQGFNNAIVNIKNQAKA